MPDPSKPSPSPAAHGGDPGAIDAASGQPTVHHVPRRRKRRGPVGGEDMQLNLTSMIDVIFLLLIYFVITANFAINEGVLTAKLPQGSGTPTQSAKPPELPLHIVLTEIPPAGCAINLEKQRVGSFTQLTQRLIAMQQDPSRGRTGSNPPDTPVIIKPDGPVRWQHVVNAFNAAVRGRYSNVRFAQAGQ